MDYINISFIDEHRTGDVSRTKSNEDKLDYLTNQETNEANYFLPHYTNNEETEEEDDDETFLDYDYDIKESIYKDSPDLATVKSNEEILGADDKIPLHTAKDNLPIFLLEPENTYVVKNKPATLKCRAANALEVSIAKPLISVIMFLS